MTRIYRETGETCVACGTKSPRRWHGFNNYCATCVQTAYTGLVKAPGNLLRTSHKPCHNGPHLKRTNKNNPRRCIVCTPKQIDHPPSDLKPELKAKEWYEPTTPCAACNTLALRHIDGRCQGCDTLTGDPHRTPRQVALDMGRRWYEPESLCPKCRTYTERSVSNGKCRQCHPEQRASYSPRQKALRAGEKWYTPTDPCKHCGLTALRRVNDGVCQGCKPVIIDQPSARAIAKANGEKWYTPDEPCKHCHVLSPKYVPNGRCKACETIKPADREIMNVMALTRENALLWGYGVYHDGTHWRLV